LNNRQKRKTEKLLVEVMLTGTSNDHLLWGSYAYDADLIRLRTDANKWEITDKGRKYLERNK
jgi:hypothetical protein